MDPVSTFFGVPISALECLLLAGLLLVSLILGLHRLGLSLVLATLACWGLVRGQEALVPQPSALHPTTPAAFLDGGYFLTAALLLFLVYDLMGDS